MLLQPDEYMLKIRSLCGTDVLKTATDGAIRNCEGPTKPKSRRTALVSQIQSS